MDYGTYQKLFPKEYVLIRTGHLIELSALNWSFTVILNSKGNIYCLNIYNLYT